MDSYYFQFTIVRVSYTNKASPKSLASVKVARKGWNCAFYILVKFSYRNEVSSHISRLPVRLN